MQSGKLRNRIALYVLPAVQTDSGAVVEGTPELFVNAWAAIETVSTPQTEGVAGGRVNAQLLHDVVMRYVAGVLPTMRVTVNSGPFEGRNFDIVQVDEGLSHRGQLTLKCREYRTNATP